MGIECYLVKLKLEDEQSYDEVKDIVLGYDGSVCLTKNNFEIRRPNCVIEIMLGFGDISIRFALCNPPEVDHFLLELIRALRENIELSCVDTESEILAEISQERAYWQGDFGKETFPYSISEAIQKIILQEDLSLPSN